MTIKSLIFYMHTLCWLHIDPMRINFETMLYGIITLIFFMTVHKNTQVCLIYLYFLGLYSFYICWNLLSNESIKWKSNDRIILLYVIASAKIIVMCIFVDASNIRIQMCCKRFCFALFPRSSLLSNAFEFSFTNDYLDIITDLINLKLENGYPLSSKHVLA